MKPTVRAAAVPLVSALALASTPALAQEPPEPPGFSCQVLAQRAGDGLALDLHFTNAGDTDLQIGPGPHLVWYRDAAAQEPMERTARATRVLNAPLTVPARGSQRALFAIGPRDWQALRCNSAAPAAAALYVYQFSQRPRFRCLLQGYDLAQQPPPATEALPCR